MLLAGWNPWHGCHRISEGCRHCYVFRMDSHYGRISDAVHKNRDFDLPVRKNRDGSYKIPSGEEVYTCFTSDFFLEDAAEAGIGCGRCCALCGDHACEDILQKIG